jgi:glycerate dehydrogenase
MKAVFLDVASLGEDLSMERLQEKELLWTFFSETQPDDVLSRIQGAEVVVTNKVVLTAEVLQQCPHLKLICVAATGYNNIDVKAAKERGILVCNVPNYSTASVVQLVLTFILTLASSFIPYIQAVQSGEWERHSQFSLLTFPISELEGKVLGIIGYGTLGKQVAVVAKSLGMKVLIAQHKAIAEGVPLDTVLEQSDFVTIHVPLTAQTRNLISRRELERMKPSAFLIHTARGGIVNERDLAECLKARRIAGAGVDVLTSEPPTKGNPLLEKEIPNLWITPHIAWGSLEARRRLLEKLRENIVSFLQNTPKNIVN